MRGLKHGYRKRLPFHNEVASFTDAWIETQRSKARIMQARVASFTDAWIETLDLAKGFNSELVASFTDAWIETACALVN